MDTYKRAYIKLGNQGLFDSEERTSMLSSLGNPLERLAGTVDFEMFRETLEAGLYRNRLTKAGAKPYDYVLMFKILVLQRMYNLSDEQTEYQIVDRTSFRDFLGLASGDKVPDAIAAHGCPEIINSDQDSQFTSNEYVFSLKFGNV